MKKIIKKIICYVYLRLKGVDTKYGYCNLVGFPIIKKTKGSKIIIEKDVTIVSKTKGNIAGINHPSILATLTEKAEIVLKTGSGVSGAKLVCVDRIELGEDSGWGVNTTVYDTDFHPIGRKNRKNQKSLLDAKSKVVLIGDGVLVGANSIILKGTTIEEGVVVGAGSVVTGGILEKNYIYAGNPIKKIRKIEENEYEK